MRTPARSRNVYGIGLAVGMAATCSSLGQTPERSSSQHETNIAKHATELSANQEGEPGTTGVAEAGTGWLDPWPHTHFSASGTPRVHHFTLEPAFLGRDLILAAHVVNGPEEDEVEFEAELEWALTRRLGLIIEAPLVSVKPEGEERQTGLGDAVVGLRGVLVDASRFTLSAGVGVSFPTGDEDRGLGAGELGVSPALAAWFDLGHWVTLAIDAKTEHALERGDSAFEFRSGLAWTFMAPGSSAANTDGVHFSPGMTSLMFETGSRALLDGDDRGRVTHEVLLGLSCSVSASLDLRAGIVLPIGSEKEFDHGLVVGAVVHF